MKHGITYLSNSRFPSEMANTVQIMNMCHAIAEYGYKVNLLKPYRFNYKSDASETFDGFFAHEAQAVVPQSGVGEKDATNEDGSIDPQCIDQSKLVPLLVAAVKELITKVETLEAA